MNSQDLNKISQNPKFAPGKRKVHTKVRTVKDLFVDVATTTAFKDKRGRPWIKNPRAYAKQQVAKRANTNYSSSDESVSNLNVSSTDEDSDLSADSDGDPFECIADLQGADWYALSSDATPAAKATRRLALLHFDWDHSKPETIYMILESFLPARGHIEKVTIYPSKFGIDRMTDEAVNGPLELRQIESDNKDNETIELPNNVDVDEKVGWRHAPRTLRRRIREYQLARLKYFYAIIEFDSVETAEAIYQACDGLEYESSGSRLDLRFVADDECFNIQPEHAHLVTECREINKAKYNPQRFETSALRSTRIGITWEKTPIERTIWFRDQFKVDVDPQRTLTEDRDELAKYVALSSSGASTAASSDVDAEPPAPTVPRIHRHRPKKLPPDEIRAALLGSSDKAEDMEEENAMSIDEVEEEVMDLSTKHTSQNGDSDADEAYDLGPVEKTPNNRFEITRKVRRKVLVEAEEPVKRDDLSSDEGLNEAEDLCNQTDNKQKKRKKKLRQRAKMLEKKRKVQSRLEREATLWSWGDDVPFTELDDRFDAFLKNPAFEISQTHPDYKEAKDFLRYMNWRKSNLFSELA